MISYHDTLLWNVSKEQRELLDKLLPNSSATRFFDEYRKRKITNDLLQDAVNLIMEMREGSEKYLKKYEIEVDSVESDFMEIHKNLDKACNAEVNRFDEIKAVRAIILSKINNTHELLKKEAILELIFDENLKMNKVDISGWRVLDNFAMRKQQEAISKDYDEERFRDFLMVYENNTENGTVEKYIEMMMKEELTVTQRSEIEEYKKDLKKREKMEKCREKLARLFHTNSYIVKKSYARIFKISGTWKQHYKEICRILNEIQTFARYSEIDKKTEIEKIQSFSHFRESETTANVIQQEYEELEKFALEVQSTLKELVEVEKFSTK
ncbi:unnamed protein product [Caenorhabditis angaria]|uniref:Uncharacterized protein n=1 Tax=Caenorhabditis angaria TaxID=860376 RepID=A0A9P1J333_9PELO|nr:unnamed protein product [Caenorhabditis angaria]